jgi:hypothetical protein
MFARCVGICGSPFRIGTSPNCSWNEASRLTTPPFWCWVQRYAPELNRRCRRELKTNGSWRVDETYICQGESWRYLYRAVDSTGATIDFWFSAERDAAAAKRFFQKALQAPGHPRPRVITVDGNPSYPKVIAELKQERKMGRRCRCRTCPYLNNHDPERPSEVVAERRCTWANSVYPGNPRIESCIVDRRDCRLVRFRRQNCFCNATRKWPRATRRICVRGLAMAVAACTSR